MAGGSTIIPKIRQFLRKEFGSTSLRYVKNAGEVMAYGATVCAARFMKRVRPEDIDTIKPSISK